MGVQDEFWVVHGLVLDVNGSVNGNGNGNGNGNVFPKRNPMRPMQWMNKTNDGDVMVMSVGRLEAVARGLNGERICVVMKLGDDECQR